MELEEWNLVDVSSFFLFESTGDSELDSSLDNTISLTNDVDVADEDAESFCYDSYDITLDDEFQDYGVKNEDNHNDDLEEEDVVDQEWSCGGGESMVYIDEQMHKGDNDRHFWEACLAS